MLCFTGRTADDVWRLAAAGLIPGGSSDAHVGRGGETREQLHVCLEILEPRERWIVSRTPALNPAFALVEVFWIAGGREDSALPVHWNPKLAKYSGTGECFHGAYGHRLRQRFGVDQLDRVFHALQLNPATRQTVLQIWDAAADLPLESGEPAAADIPCNVIAIPKVRRGRLEWLQILRSNDAFRGFPHNVVQFTVLQEMIAGWLRLEVGAYNHISDSFHVYEADIEAVSRSLRQPAPKIEANSDSWALAREDWDDAMEVALMRLEAMTATGIGKMELQELAFAGDLPTAYENAVRIAAADSARR